MLTLSWVLMPRRQLWKPFIVVASYVFYAAANPRFCLLLGGITLISQIAAQMLARTEDETKRKWITGVAVGLDLATLGVFKYYSFFVQDISDLLDTMHLGTPLPLLTVALPIGISFFTFQAITYVVDVKRRQVEPASTIDAAIYLSFFPHLVAGPIVRASEFLPQLRQPRDPNKVAVGAGLSLIALGMIKKVMIADYLARTIVDPAFGVPQAYAGPDLLIAAYAYAAQIYCDFSGYTDMAIGLALLMGFIFPQNFNSPYRATGFRDFWRRWHMTLSRFLRDYLYIPLGGSRGSRLFTYRNLMITMVLGGLWHGAAWTFVFWGTFQGLGLVSEHALGREDRPPHPRLAALVRHLQPDRLRLDPLPLEPTSASSAPTSAASSWPGPLTLVTVPVVLALIVVIGMQLLPPRPLERLQVWIEGLNPIGLAAGVAVTILIVGATVPSQGVPPFIYFQF